MAYKRVSMSFEFGERLNLAEEVGKVFEGVYTGVRVVDTPNGQNDTGIVADFIGLDGKKYSAFLPAQLTQKLTFTDPETGNVLPEPEFYEKRLRIEYTGKVKAKRGKMNSFNVDVWEDEGETDDGIPF